MASNRNGNPKCSAKQREANRKNSADSTGPRTPAGKERVRWNRVTHGLCTQEILLPGEDGEALENLASQMHAEAQPVGVEEGVLVERMIVCLWRLHRLARVETGIFMSEHWALLRSRERRKALEHTRLEGDESTMDQLTRSIERMPAFSRKIKTQQALAKQALATEQEMARHAEADTPTLGQTFIRGVSGVDALSKLARYEAHIERCYYRTRHELERCQLKRQGKHVPAPLAVDMTVTGEASASSGLCDQGTMQKEEIAPPDIEAELFEK